MGVKLEFDRETNAVTVSEPESVGALVRGFYGKMDRGTIMLTPEEALYLIDIRNGEIRDKSLNELKFNELASKFTTPKLMARYFTYKDWRDRGLILRPVEEAHGDYGMNPVKRYPKGVFKPPKYALQGLFFSEDLVAVIDDETTGKELYDNYWLGQFGSYKAEHRGRLLKLDVYETVFMMKHCGLSLANSTQGDVVKLAKKRRPDFPLMYQVYEDWRLHGFILKSGFKFGTHFRLYFPNASPTREIEKWIHSKHVIHVFPRRSKMIISEWARAIRVAHSVKKTFILAIPGSRAKKQRRQELDFLLYHRKKGGIETPKDGRPRFLMFSLSEEEQIGGEELAQAIEESKAKGLELMLAIADRETAVTYYKVRRIQLPGSKYEYYEIDWQQP